VKFIVDAQLPKALSDLINSSKQDSIHTLELPDKNKTEDGFIIQVAINEQRIVIQRIVITKDADFLESYILRKEPPKLLLIKTGNIKNSELISLFNKNSDHLVAIFSNHSLVEITKDEIVVHA
jgi:predicted nuclease of predicted toxin-antitoxin system